VELYEAMRTTAAVRDFVPEAVPHDVLYRILEHARFATNGGNRQGWRVIVVEDPALRRAVRDLYRAGVREGMAYIAQGRLSFGLDERGCWPGPVADRDAARRGEGIEVQGPHSRVSAFAEHLDESPVLLVLCADLRVLAVTDVEAPHQSIVGGGSIYPFAQNILLAARNEGLGGVLTTALCADVPAARELLGVPESFAIAALIPLGRPRRQVMRLTRRPVEEFVRIDSFDGRPLAARSHE
jgi:nitroreductase